MIQKNFLRNALENIRADPYALGLAVGGSWISNEIDEFSDLDLILVSQNRIAPDFESMSSYAKKFGSLLNAFTGEHVGEPRVLICLFDNPLLHVDIKFLTREEFRSRIEDPVVVWERDNVLTEIVRSTESQWPALRFQWIEDRFWTWVHYAALKLGRGENFEALDFLSFIRTTVISPLLQIKNGQLPRGLRKVEFNLSESDLNKLIQTVPEYSAKSIFDSLDISISLYKHLRSQLYPNTVRINTIAEEKVLLFLEEIKSRRLSGK